MIGPKSLSKLHSLVGIWGWVFHLPVQRADHTTTHFQRWYQHTKNRTIWGAKSLVSLFTYKNQGPLNIIIIIYSRENAATYACKWIQIKQQDVKYPTQLTGGFGSFWGCFFTGSWSAGVFLTEKVFQVGGPVKPFYWHHFIQGREFTMTFPKNKWFVSTILVKGNGCLP